MPPISASAGLPPEGNSWSYGTPSSRSSHRHKIAPDHSSRSWRVSKQPSCSAVRILMDQDDECLEG